MHIFSHQPDRYQESTPEGKIHWGRGLLILASMAGVFLIFFVVLSLLQYGERENPDIRGLATVAAARAASTPAAATPASQATPASTAPGSPTGVTAVVRQDPYVRSGPGINYPILTNLRDGDVVPIIGRTPDISWLQVMLPNGVRGWSGAGFLTVQGNINNVPVTQ